MVLPLPFADVSIIAKQHVNGGAKWGRRGSTQRQPKLLHRRGKPAGVAPFALFAHSVVLVLFVANTINAVPLQGTSTAMNLTWGIAPG
jgi:hypothetical protein